MISRAEAVAMIDAQLDGRADTVVLPPQQPYRGAPINTSKATGRYGRLELRALLDAIYGPPDPCNGKEHLKAK